MVSWLAQLAACQYYCIPLIGAALLVGGCGASTNISTASAGTATPTATLAPTATASPSPTPVSIVKHEEFTCPETLSGADKVIADSSIFLSVAYPGTWKETHCIRTRFSDGGVTLWIGNYVHIDAVPDTSMTVQQWVDAHKTSYETVTLQPISSIRAPHRLPTSTSHRSERCCAARTISTCCPRRSTWSTWIPALTP